MAGRVAGKVAIVTGAASGLGAADARLLADEGATVIATDINVAAGDALAFQRFGLSELFPQKRQHRHPRLSPFYFKFPGPSQ